MLKLISYQVNSLNFHTPVAVDLVPLANKIQETSLLLTNNQVAVEREVIIIVMWQRSWN